MDELFLFIRVVFLSSWSCGLATAASPWRLIAQPKLLSNQYGKRRDRKVPCNCLPWATILIWCDQENGLSSSIIPFGWNSNLILFKIVYNLLDIWVSLPCLNKTFRISFYYLSCCCQHLAEKSIRYSRNSGSETKKEKNDFGDGCISNLSSRSLFKRFPYCFTII